MAEKSKQFFYCKRCNCEISKEEHDKAMKIKFLPLCKKCEPEMREKFEKWYPIFQKFKL